MDKAVLSSQRIGTKVYQPIPFDVTSAFSQRNLRKKLRFCQSRKYASLLNQRLEIYNNFQSV